jgi:hypothetical protein
MADAIDAKINRVSLFDYFILDGTKITLKGNRKKGDIQNGANGGGFGLNRKAVLYI